jgi:hypothetical protein
MDHIFRPFDLPIIENFLGAFHQKNNNSSKKEKVRRNRKARCPFLEFAMQGKTVDPNSASQRTPVLR